MANERESGRYSDVSWSTWECRMLLLAEHPASLLAFPLIGRLVWEQKCAERDGVMSEQHQETAGTLGGPRKLSWLLHSPASRG